MGSSVSTTATLSLGFGATIIVAVIVGIAISYANLSSSTSNTEIDSSTDDLIDEDNINDGDLEPDENMNNTNNVDGSFNLDGGSIIVDGQEIDVDDPNNNDDNVDTEVVYECDAQDDTEQLTAEKYMSASSATFNGDEWTFKNGYAICAAGNLFKDNGANQFCTTSTKCSDQNDSDSCVDGTLKGNVCQWSSSISSIDIDS